MTVQRNIPIGIDDGATLHANIAYPSNRPIGQRAAGSFLVILAQDPYDVPLTSDASLPPKSHYVTPGYIFAVTQLRGTGQTKRAHSAAWCLINCSVHVRRATAPGRGREM